MLVVIIKVLSNDYHLRDTSISVGATGGNSGDWKFHLFSGCQHLYPTEQGKYIGSRTKMKIITNIHYFNGKSVYSFISTWRDI